MITTKQLKLPLCSLFLSFLCFSCTEKQNNPEQQAYCIFENVSISNEEKMETYKSQVTAIVNKYEGEYIAASKDIDYMEGDWRPNFLIVIKFPSMKKAKEWYNSDDYKSLKELRLSSGDFNAVFFEGYK